MSNKLAPMLQEEKKNEIHNSLNKLLLDLEIQSEKGMSLHEVELSLFRSLLRMGYQLLTYYLFLVGEIVSGQDRPADSSGKGLRNKGFCSRKYRSIFGIHQVRRRKYIYASGQSYYPLDEQLSLPEGVYSYVLSDWLGYGAVEMDFDQSVCFLNRILGQDLKAMQSSRQAYALSEQVESYYENYEWENDGQATHLSVGFDGKGVPIIRSQTGRASESVSVRLNKGAKKGVKKEATVSVSSSFTARTRSPEEILTALFSAQKPDTPPKEASCESPNKHRWHDNKHIRAFLSNKRKAINYGIEQVIQRDPQENKPIIVLIDGDRSLEKTVKEIMAEKQIEGRVDAYILDFIHLLEYVWKVANAHLGETHPDRQEWVKEQASMLLNSQTQEVIAGWIEIEKQDKLSKTQNKNVKAAISYLTNRPHMLDYKTYLQKGFPITTGAVESACGHFVKSRMEQNAMHWGKIGAQKMLNLRAVKKNGHWQDYIDKFIQKQHQSIYQKVA